jgi:phosphatidylserine/phosphatidylglycerophosphate/cardiolipin synthase-like enzyme
MHLPAFPRMHHKFIVFCRNEESTSGYSNYEPYAVWTGSFNFTKNAGFSFENAVFLRDERLAMAYFREYAEIAAISEPLNWDSEWIQPQWRDGS